MKPISIFRALLISGAALSLVSCFDDNEENYDDWKKLNDEYIVKAEKETAPDGSLLYQRIVPNWASQTFALVRWHNDRKLTAGNLSPLDNSTINMKYETLDIDDNVLSTSATMHQYGDSIYQTRPSDMIIGVRAVLPYMHVGDSVSLVLPYTAAYGTTAYGDIKPFSTLKFNIKLVSIPSYMVE